jgi:hypothetical protein
VEPFALQTREYNGIVLLDLRTGGEIKIFCITLLFEGVTSGLTTITVNIVSVRIG